MPVRLIVPEPVNAPVKESAASDLRKLALSIPSSVAASTLVKLAPDAAGNVAGNLASGIVPEFKLLALPAVKPPEVPVILSVVLARFVPLTDGTPLKSP